MGWVHYVGRSPSRVRLLKGDVPAWIKNSKRCKYISAVLLSTPPWVTTRELRALHERAVWMSEMTGIPHVLDHIVPLTHPRVCGLTVPWNIEVVPHKVNQAKSNNWCPEQEELFT